MSKARAFLREHKAILSVAVLIISISIMVMAIMGIPDRDGTEGTGPLASLKGINIILIIVTVIISLVGSYVLYKYMSDKSRFEDLMGRQSQAIFKRNQIEIERLALRLTSKEEERVLEAIRKYKIR